MEWGTPVYWGWFLLFSRSGGHKTKETYLTRPGSPTPCKQGLIHRFLLGKIPKYLLIIQAVELICQTNSDAAVFEMHHNDFFAKTCHSGVEFYFCGGDRELKQGCKNCYIRSSTHWCLGKFLIDKPLHRVYLSARIMVVVERGTIGDRVVWWNV